MIEGYISKTRVVEMMCWELCGQHDGVVCDLTKGDCNEIRKILKEPCADVVPVIRCRDCRYHNMRKCENTGLWPVTDEDFCSIGERRDGEIH